MLLKNLLYITILFLIFSCGDANSSESNSYGGSGYSDGRYCAEITYYYSNTGTTSEYILPVEIENNELVKIFWPNGGWLDETHFTPPDISDGTATFESDQGVEYTINILRSGNCDYSSNAPDEESFIQSNEDKDEVCPNCGNDKYSWKDYCRRCEDKIENTCSKCGGHEYGINGGTCSTCELEHTCMMCGGYMSSSWDDMCSSCRRNEEREDIDDC